MSNSIHWIRHSTIVYLGSLLGELVTEKKLDKVTITPARREFEEANKIVEILPGDDEHSFEGVTGDDPVLEAKINIVCRGDVDASEGIVLSLESIIANVRDKITEGITSETGFKSLDPPVQVEGCSVVMDPSYSGEMDISYTVLELRISNHG